jgi:hypothetical protein
MFQRLAYGVFYATIGRSFDYKMVLLFNALSKPKYIPIWIANII